MNFSLIIPTYNEKENIIPLLEKLSKILGKEKESEIIVVDDNSPDLTWKFALSHSQNNEGIKVIRRMEERGLSSAVMEGFREAKGEILGVMDADLSHDPEILPEMISAVQNEEYELVVGSRRIPGGGAEKWPWYRKVFSDIATFAAKRFLDIELSDPMSGFFIMKRPLFKEAAQSINPRGYKILLEIYVRTKPQKLKEIPYIFKDRKQGYSKLSLNVMFEYLQMLYELRIKSKKK
jgi:dolichol-phosphate mannosyltransferase